MHKSRIGQRVVLLIVIGILFLSGGFKSQVYAANSVLTRTLNQGMKGEDVKKLQQRLKQMNMFEGVVTGYFGSITKNSVMRFQKSKGINEDGVVGENTANHLFNQSSSRPRANTVSRGGLERPNLLVPWFGGAENIFSVGTKALVTDLDSGISFWVVRTGGKNHADSETQSMKDTHLLNKIYGGEWSWERRAVIVTVGTRKIAASITGMPHAGREDMPAREVVDNRSAGYGTGVNYDSIKGNGMSGHFDIHFLGSKTHGTNRIDEGHQAMVQKAARG